MVFVTDGKAIDDSDANPQHVLGRFLTSHKQHEQVREMDPIPVRVITAQGW